MAIHKEEIKTNQRMNEFTKDEKNFNIIKLNYEITR